jgi:hypothetical protein
MAHAEQMLERKSDRWVTITRDDGQAGRPHMASALSLLLLI